LASLKIAESIRADAVANFISVLLCVRKEITYTDGDGNGGADQNQGHHRRLAADFGWKLTGRELPALFALKSAKGSVEECSYKPGSRLCAAAVPTLNRLTASWTFVCHIDFLSIGVIVSGPF
jgi:hypothetical protein